MEPEQAEQPKQRTDHTADGLLTGRGIWPVANEHHREAGRDAVAGLELSHVLLQLRPAGSAPVNVRSEEQSGAEQSEEKERGGEAHLMSLLIWVPEILAAGALAGAVLTLPPDSSALP